MRNLLRSFTFRETKVRAKSNSESRTLPIRNDRLRVEEQVAVFRERLNLRSDAKRTVQLLADVREARALVRGFDSRDVAASSLGRYTRVATQMRAAGSHPEDAGCRNTFEFKRAALVFTSRSELKVALRDLDKHRRTGNAPAVAEAYTRLLDGLSTLRRYPPTTGSREKDRLRTSAFQGPARPEPSRSNSKRASITGLPPDWRDAVQREINVPDRAALAAIALTGCRPIEVRGIRVRQASDEYLTLTIRGAKLGDERGIETRSNHLGRTELTKTQAGRDLLNWLGTREQRTIAYPGSVEAFRERVSRAADRARLPHVSTYTYRHAIARELKDSGLNRTEIAERLGHRSKRSQSVYG